ncbi:MAG: hypothetical protein ABH875_03420 [Candidatus Omnitrophota bacterium]
MKKLIGVIIVFGAALLVAGAFMVYKGQATPVADRSLPVEDEPLLVADTPTVDEVQPLPFYDGEQLVFDVYYKALKIGNSKLTFHGERELDGESFYYITFNTNAPAFKDDEEIYAYKGSFLPYRILRNIKRGGAFPIKIYEEYDQESFEVIIKEKGTILSKTRTIKKGQPIHNALLLTYLYRTMVNPERRRISIPMSDFDIVSEGERTVMTGQGERLAHIFTGEPSKFTFWLSADDDMVPLKIVGHNMLDYSFVLVNVENVAQLSSRE